MKPSAYTTNDGVFERVSTSTYQASGISRELLRQHLVLLHFLYRWAFVSVEQSVVCRRAVVLGSLTAMT